MHADTARKLNLTLKPCQKELRDAQHNLMKVVGQCEIAFTLYRKLYVETFIIVEQLDGAALIGLTFARQFTSIRIIVNADDIDVDFYGADEATVARGSLPKVVQPSTSKKQATQDTKQANPSTQKEKSPKKAANAERGKCYARESRELSPDIYSTQFYKTSDDADEEEETSPPPDANNFTSSTENEAGENTQPPQAQILPAKLLNPASANKTPQVSPAKQVAPSGADNDENASNIHFDPISTICDMFCNVVGGSYVDGLKMEWKPVFPPQIFRVRTQLLDRLAAHATPTEADLETFEGMLGQLQDSVTNPHLLPVEKYAICLFWRTYLSVLYLTRQTFGDYQLHAPFLKISLLTLERFKGDTLIDAINEDASFKSHLDKEIDGIAAIFNKDIEEHDPFSLDF
uniref:Uncharacterized protein n=1 Tax=Panagrolaimus sp. ES5 TaxID=591445 RepID=A0AC34FX93_9BILA